MVGEESMPLPDIRTGINYNPDYLRGMDTTPLDTMTPSIPTYQLPSNPDPQMVNTVAVPDLKSNDAVAAPTVGKAGGFAPISSVLSLGLGIKQLYDAGKVKVEDTVPQQVKDNYGKQRLRAASSLTPDYALQQENKNITATNTINAARTGATSTDQVIQAALGAQRNANAFDRSISSAGEALQERNIDREQNIGQDIGDRQRQDKIDAAKRRALLIEGGMRNLGNFAGGADQALGAIV